VRQQLFSGKGSDCSIPNSLCPSAFNLLVRLQYVSALTRYVDNTLVVPHFIRPKSDYVDLYSLIDDSSARIRMESSQPFSRFFSQKNCRMNMLGSTVLLRRSSLVFHGVVILPSSMMICLSA